MARSEKNGSGYWSDEYKHSKNRHGSSRGSVNKIKRKKMRDATASFGQGGLQSIDSMPTRTFTQRYSLDTVYNSETTEYRHDNVKRYREKVEELDEKKEQLKLEKLSEKFEEWSAGKTNRTVRKALKKSKREGLEHPFEEESTDSEIEREIEKSRSKLVGANQEVVKYLETGSGKSFQWERHYSTK
ncbi:hypothetical protein NAEGRDRAFT_58431 [Naegleria gruberi]|uniref:Uncharacterized protein n=1 Tax=Naegleria gruberi TaxID=5762 RepID=D2VJX2_NAEGR|nr:uncharacterized protein NAEGRDRAFT_58431 [Naegleria gruberi]EFC42765.1 hypothetical protein NAEGRDRAFT_58431 [Naegleria gruberi]|eukprot:XP_002675509.1 hypothetical protein NAEGRDRAFT_58431 [Naegleria gruberi strain NEG-M]